MSLRVDDGRGAPWGSAEPAPQGTGASLAQAKGNQRLPAYAQRSHEHTSCFLATGCRAFQAVACR